MSQTPRGSSLAELGTAVAHGELLASHLVQEALERIGERNGELNAVIALRGVEAANEARAFDEYVRAGGRAGPLAGVPMLVKDTDDVAGLPTTKGSRVLADTPPADQDGLVVSRLRAAGAIVVGKSNTPEFAIEGFTANLLQGVTRNPWNPSMSPGGSSGGSASALSAGMVPLATGTDGGGSVRIPAGVCGLVGLKPTNGVVGRRRTPEWIDFATDGFMATRTEDVRLLLSVVAGPEPGDPTAHWGPLPDGRMPTRLIAAHRTDALGELPTAVAEAFGTAVEKLSALLAIAAEWKAPDSFFAGGSPDVDWFTIATAEHVAALGREVVMEHLHDMHPSTQQFLCDGLTVGIDDYLGARLRRLDYIRQLDRLLGDGAILVTPTLAVEGFTAEGRLVDDGTQDLLPPEVYSTAIQNLTGLPAVSVPAGFLPNGLPFGLQVTAPRYADRMLLDVAQLWEAAHPWPRTAPGYSEFGGSAL